MIFLTEPFMGIDWKAFGILSGFLLGWTMLLVSIIAWLLKRGLSSYDDKLEKLETSITSEASTRAAGDKATAAKHEKLEQDFRHFLADLPKQYVQREDWIRTWASVDVKMDNIMKSIIDLIKDKGT